MAGNWKKITNAADLQRSSHVVSAIKSSLYVFGGELIPREPRDNKLFKIEASSSGGCVETVSTQFKAPSARVGSATTVLGDKIYLFSGRGGIEMKPIEERGQLHVFDVTTSSWDVVGPVDGALAYPPARSYHCMTSDGVSTLFVHAGCPESGRLSDFWAFDINANKWMELPAAPGPARGGTSMAFAGGRVYRMNGFDGTREQGGGIDVFDLGRGKWSTIEFEADGKMGPEARSVSALLAVRVGGKTKLVTMFGERDPSSLGHVGAGKMLDDWWMFDVESGKWEQGHSDGEKPVARGWFAADVVGEREVAVVGGLSENNERLGDVWMLSL